MSHFSFSSFKSFRFFLINFFFLFHQLNSNYISIPFKNSRSLSSLPSSASSEQICEYLVETDLTVNIKVGTELQVIPMSLSLWNKYIYITSNLLANGVYDKDKSLSFNKKEEEPMGDQSYFKKGQYCTDTFVFDTDKNIKNENTSFILTTEMEYKTEYRKGLIGLQITSYRQEETLINQLKSKDLINNYYHFLKFDSEDEGIFVIGATPHEYSPQKYSYNDFRQVNAREVSQSWELSMINIKYGDTKFDNKNFDLDFKFGLISVGLFIKQEYYNDFFAKRIEDGLCEEILYKDYYIYSCIDNDSKVKFNELKGFHFYNLGLEYDFIFTYKDLFISFNNRKYFLITHKKGAMTTILGKPFFRKYTMIFNPDNKQMGHYIKEEEIIENKDGKTLIYIIIILILLIILVSLGIVFLKFFGRKKRKNELDENYDYIPDEKNSIGINQ